MKGTIQPGDVKTVDFNRRLIMCGRKEIYFSGAPNFPLGLYASNAQRAINLKEMSLEEKHLKRVIDSN